MKTPRRTINYWEIGAAAMLLLLGLFMVVKGFEYPFGTMVRIGPGFFPVLTGGALILLAAATMFEVRHADTSPPDVPLRPLACIMTALVLFALLVGRAGLVPATFVLVFLSAAGERSVNWIRTALVAVAMSCIGWLLFVLAFNLPISPFWW